MQKAVFYIGNDAPIIHTFQKSNAYVVQINPASIKHDINPSVSQSTPVKTLEDLIKGWFSGTGAQETGATVSVSGVNETVSMTLYFDMISMSPDVKNEGEDFATGSGTIHGVRAFKALKKAAGHGLPVLFMWGKMKFNGYISSFSSEYTYFSEDGDVKRVKVDLSIATCKVSGKNIGDIVDISEMMSSSWSSGSLKALRDEAESADLLRN